jgi:Fur family transcriptional regulator, ferric uptake regulator
LTAAGGALYTPCVKTEKGFQFHGGTRPQGGRGAAQHRAAVRGPAGRRGSARAQLMLRAIADAGYSDTRARRAVVGALCAVPAGATPAQLLSKARRMHSGLGQVTVYRTLEILSGLGLVRKLHAERGCPSYAAATRRHGHYVICRQCRKAAEFEGCAVESALGRVTAQTGYEVSGHWLELFGLCPDCRRKSSGRGKA